MDLPLTIEIIEQPSFSHRFRYEKEVVGRKIGSILYGRSSTSNKKSFVKVRISGIQPDYHKTVCLIGGTVNSEGYPHPYYLIGDNCNQGFYTKKINVDGTTQGFYDIILDKLNIVCMSKKAAELTKAMDQRKSIKFDPFTRGYEYNYANKEMDRVSLAFKVYFTTIIDEQNYVTNTVPVTTESIIDNKVIKPYVIEEIHPKVALFNVPTTVWIYIRSPIPMSVQKEHVKIILESFELGLDYLESYTCVCTCLKRQLIVFETPVMLTDYKCLDQICHRNRLKTNLTLEICSGDEVGRSENNVEFMFDVICPTCQKGSQPGSPLETSKLARKRGNTSNSSGSAQQRAKKIIRNSPASTSTYMFDESNYLSDSCYIDDLLGTLMSDFLEVPGCVQPELERIDLKQISSIIGSNNT